MLPDIDIFLDIALRGMSCGSHEARIQGDKRTLVAFR